MRNFFPVVDWLSFMASQPAMGITITEFASIQHIKCVRLALRQKSQIHVLNFVVLHRGINQEYVFFAHIQLSIGAFQNRNHFDMII